MSKQILRGLQPGSSRYTAAAFKPLIDTPEEAYLAAFDAGTGKAV